MEERCAKNAVETIVLTKEVMRSRVASVPLNEKECNVELSELTKNYRASMKVSSENFPKPAPRMIEELSLFNFGTCSVEEAAEKMSLIGCVLANVYETLAGIGKKTGMTMGMMVMACGSSYDPIENYHMYPFVKVNGEHILNCAVIIDSEPKLFAGAKLKEGGC